MANRAPFPIHPGEILREEVLMPLGMSIAQLARELNVPPNRLSLIIAGQRGISPDTSLRLARYLGCSDDYWLRLQNRYDLDVLKQTSAKKIQSEVKPRKDSAAA